MTTKLGVLRIRERDFAKLAAHLNLNREVETAAMGFHLMSESRDRVTFLVQEILLPEKDDYHHRSIGGVSLKPALAERCHQKCEQNNWHLLDIHTHPWADHKVAFSGIDDDQAMNTKIPYLKRYVPGTRIAFLVFGKNPGIVRGRYWDGVNHCLSPIHRIVVL